jgi:hypothetical protein
VVGLVAFVVIARPHALLGGLIGAVPSVVVAVIAAYQAQDVASGDMTNKAVEQGHDLALVVLGCAFLAATLRVLGLKLDRSTRIRDRTHAFVLRVAAVGVAVGLGVGLTVGGAGFLDRQYDRFVHGGVEEKQIRNRLTQVGNRGRISHWEVALKGFRRERLHGQGVGTYPILWSLYRPSTFTTTEGHSLYLETLGELGLVGLVLLVASLGTLLAGVATAARGRSRTVYAALFSAMVAWAIQAGVDWLWEMPAVTRWVFAAGGAALASPPRELDAARGTQPRTRVVIALGVLLLAVTPALLGISQRHLNDSVRAFKHGDCPAAVDAALASISAVGSRPEPYEVIGYCDARMGLGRLAFTAFHSAIRRDPRNWELQYGLAIARASSGLDPRSAARSALRLNPFSDLAKRAVKRFDTGSPAVWRRRARTAPLPIP